MLHSNQIEQLLINEPRLRTLISIERNIAQFFTAPERFKASLTDLANILSLCISQEDEVSQHIRGKLNIGDDLLTDTQLGKFSVVICMALISTRCIPLVIW